MSARMTPLIYVTVKDGAGNKARITEQTNRVKSLEYTDSQKIADKCVLTVDNFDLSNFDDPVWSHRNFVQVSWGYPGMMALTREVVITKVSGFTELKIEARAKSVLIDTVKKSRTFKGMSRSAIVMKIAKEYGYDVELGTMHIEDTKRSFAHVTQANISDAQLIRKLAHQQGFEFYVDQAGFHFHEQKLVQDPIRAFTWYTDRGRGDVINIEVEEDITRKPGAVKKTARDPLSKETTSTEATNATDAEREGTAEVQLIMSTDLRTGSFQTSYKAEPVKPGVDTSSRVPAASVTSQLPAGSVSSSVTVGPTSTTPTAPVPVLAPIAPTGPADPLASVDPGIEASRADAAMTSGGTPVTDESLALGAQGGADAPLGSIEAVEQTGMTLAQYIQRTAAPAGPPALAEYTQGLAPGSSSYQPVESGPLMSSPEGGVEAAKTEAKAKFRASQRSAVKIVLEAVGDPNMLAKSIVTLAGVGKRLSGVYHVREVTHSVGPGKYTMKCKMVSDGTGAMQAKMIDRHAENGLPDVAGESSKAKKAPPVDTSKANVASVMAGRSVDADALIPVPVLDKSGKQIGTTFRVREHAVNYNNPVVRIEDGALKSDTE